MDRFQSILKKYKLDDLLLLIGEINRNMFINNVTFDNKNFLMKNKNYFQSVNHYICTWDLTDIIYYAICSSNDFKSNLANESELMKIVYEYSLYDNERSRVALDNIDLNDTVSYIMFGHSQKQFWYQNSQNLIEQFNRNFEMISVISKKNNSKINVDEILMKEIGFNATDFSILLIILISLGINKSDITEVNIDSDLTNKIPVCTEGNIRKIIKMYSGTYKECRKSPIKENFLFAKPIIETDSKKFIIGNQYILYKLLSDGLFWVVRNYFYNLKSQNFTNEFGNFFEYYVKELLENYLESTKYRKLKENNKRKIADWHIETNNYHILIEQKSSIASIQLKSKYPELDKLKGYLAKYYEAIQQLDATEEFLNLHNKKVIKLILHYESIYAQESVKEDLLRRFNKDYGKYTNTYFISCSELEILMSILCKNEDEFNKVMEIKIKLEEEKNLNGRSFTKVINEVSTYENDYLLNVKNHFNDILELLK